MESRMKNWRSLHYYTENILYSILYTIKLKIFTQSFYYSSSKFSKFIQGKSKISSWNNPTVHVCCFMLARASTKTFVSRVRKTAKKSSLAEVSLYLIVKIETLWGKTE